MNFHHAIILIAVLWSIIGLSVIFHLMSIMRGMAQEVEKCNILLTVMANKQGATEADVKAALGKK